MNNMKYAIQPLYDLLTRFPPSLSYLTTIHPLFIATCVQMHHFTAAIPVLSTPISIISTAFYPDLTYNDNLIYHYAGGIALAALKHWAEAEEFFEVVVSAPGQVPSAIQLEALKKLVLVQLISKGKTVNPPKYTNPILLRLLKSSPYTVLVNSYPQQIDNLRTIAKKEHELFTTEKNLGLVQQAIESAPRWSIKKLTATYLTLGLSEIGKEVGIASEDDTRKVVLDMIECSEITAQISVSGTVTFFDPPSQSQFTKADVDKVLREGEEQAALLKRLELEMARSREYLSKAIRSKEDTTWASSMDDELLFGPADRGGTSLGLGGGVYSEDLMFA
jgi:COP9 signalosome complex subunit 3